MGAFNISNETKELVEQSLKEIAQHRLSTSSCDYNQIINAISKLYSKIGYELPRNVYFARGQLEGALLYETYKTGDEDNLLKKLWDDTEKQLKCEATNWGDCTDTVYNNFCNSKFSDTEIENGFYLLSFNEIDVEFSDSDFEKLREEFFRTHWKNGLGKELWYITPQQFKKTNASQLQINNNVNSWSYEFMYAECARRIGVHFPEEALSNLDLLNDVIESCCSAYLYRDFAIIIERPIMAYTDTTGRLHNKNGMAVSFNDGTGFYAVFGVKVPGFIITNAEEITDDDIQRQTNSELKQFMLEQTML